MSFRQTFKVLTELPGSYVQGIFTPGERSVITINASIQPVRDKDMMMLTTPEGRRIQGMIKIYTSTKLKQAEEGLGQQPDIVVWQGNGYEITSMDVRQMDVISHYKILATKRMPVPDVNLWAIGTLNRG